MKRWLVLLFSLMIAPWFTGCQQYPQQVPETSQDTLPTLVSFPVEDPTTQPTVTIIPQPTRVVRTIPTRNRTATFTPQPTHLPTLTPLPTLTREPVTPTSTSLPASFSFGQSVSGQDLTAYTLSGSSGTGSDHLLLLVGGIHGGWESNTVDLMQELREHFTQTPGDLLPGVTLLVIPALNPDGVARGRVLEGRFNDHQVDLNRNWGCDWSATAYFKNQIVNPGSLAMSEPETQALAALILEMRPSVVLMYHSAANGIFTGHCNGSDAGSDAMAQILGNATGYPYGESFSAYPVSGTAVDWITEMGIPAADVELATWRTTEFDRNLRGVMALQCWLIQSHSLNGILPTLCQG